MEIKRVRCNSFRKQTSAFNIINGPSITLGVGMSDSNIHTRSESLSEVSSLSWRIHCSRYATDCQNILWLLQMCKRGEPLRYICRGKDPQPPWSTPLNVRHNEAPQIQLWCWPCAPYRCLYYYHYYVKPRPVASKMQ